MSEFKVTISDPKTGKSYHKVFDTDIFKNRRIHESVSGDSLGMKGYEFEITGGSDTSGFPMRFDVIGTAKRRVLLTSGVGVNVKRKGMKKRKMVSGNTVSLSTAQVNLKIVKHGAKKVDELMGKREEKASEEKLKEEKREEKKSSGKLEEEKNEEKDKPEKEGGE